MSNWRRPSRSSLTSRNPAPSTQLTRMRQTRSAPRPPLPSRREPRGPASSPSPRTCRTLCVKLDENCNRSPSTVSKKASSSRRWMPCPWPREVASTVAEHMNLATRDHVSTHVPGRIEGSREHTNLAIASERNNASASTSASSRGEPCARDSHARRQTRSAPRPPLRRGANHVRATHTHEGRRARRLGRGSLAAGTTRSRVEPLPSDLPDASRGRRRGASTQRRWMPCAVRATAAPRASSPAHPGWERSSIIRIRAHVNRRPAALCFRGVTRAGVTP
jgi:hypothetical protein